MGLHFLKWIFFELLAVEGERKLILTKTDRGINREII